MNIYFNIILIVLISYIVGSFPTAYIISKLVIKDDIRKFGSGNMGATNVLRTVGKVPAIITLLIDVFKGFFAVYLLAHMLNYYDDFWLRSIAGVSVIIGHIWTVFLSFKGGKGVATACGVFLGLAPFAFLLMFCLFAIIVILTRYISLASIAAAILFPIVIYLFKYHTAVLIFSITANSIIIYRHKANIKRILSGTENRFSLKG